MRRSFGWTVVLLPILGAIIFMGLYVLVGKIDPAALPHGDAGTSEKRAP